ncbi:hypothetical protein KUTeg_019022 [Tegillarca granosa]|uniref:Nuclease HARBI1 n=1 Tax=Tegillarca granosa TaxID=220873 RepID=A0ABQ9EDY1_TEGGR|nr:hypothetical protein KUTeg_019022 [Tegillarca granosa]
MAAVRCLLEPLDYAERNRNVRRGFLDRENPTECLRDEEMFAREISTPNKEKRSADTIVSGFVFLWFLATGAFHLLIGDSINISKATAGRCIKRVSEVIFSLAGEFIVFLKEMMADKEKRDLSPLLKRMKKKKIRKKENLK